VGSVRPSSSFLWRLSSLRSPAYSLLFQPAAPLVVQLVGEQARELVHNERVRLVAAFLNSLGLALVVSGWVATGVGLHLAGYYVLGRLRQ
jgi:hypothetical protein